jgi:hypothetical protein
MYGAPTSVQERDAAFHQRSIRKPHERATLEVLVSAGAHRAGRIEEEHNPFGLETDVLLASGGDALYLCNWMRKSGLADLLPSLSEMVWVGLRPGSMLMTPK